jgi:hypothetical protein
MARWRKDPLAQVLGDVRGAEGPGKAFAGQSDLCRGVADLFALAGYHGVDRGADLGGNAPGRQCIDRRRLVEHGERAFGGRVFHVRTVGASHENPQRIKT